MRVDVGLLLPCKGTYTQYIVKVISLELEDFRGELALMLSHTDRVGKKHYFPLPLTVRGKLKKYSLYPVSISRLSVWRKLKK